MSLIKNLFHHFFKKKHVQEPWLAYYHEKERSIKFTNKNIYEYLESNSKNNLDYYALNYFNHRITYQEFLDKIDLTSRSLRYFGVKPKDVVTICMPNTPEAVIMFYAINKIGAIADMLHPLSAPNQIKQALLESKSRILLLVDFDYEKMRTLIPETNVYKTIMVSPKDSMPKLLKIGYTITRGWKIKKPSLSDADYISWEEFLSRGISYKKPFINSMKSSDTAVILHSGGTTGKPKGIMISNFSFNALAQQGGVAVSKVRPGDKVMTILPIFHGFGLDVVLHCPLCLGLEVILIPEFDSKRFYDILKRYKPHVLAGVPTLWNAMLDNSKFNDVDLSNFKYVISGGDYLTLSLEERLNTFLRSHNANISVTKGYGMTESVAATAFTIEGTNEPGAVGIPMIGNSYSICKPDTTETLPLGEEGEICVTGPTIMKGYLNNKKETQKVLRKHSDGKVWLHSGDMGYISLNGVVYFTQRLKRMIVTSGFNIYPSLIEEVIETHPLVDKCCVIGVPHEYKGHVAKAFIVLKESDKSEKTIQKEISEICKKNLEVFSQPRYFEFRKELPKTLYSKIDYLKLEQEEINKNK